MRGEFRIAQVEELLKREVAATLATKVTERDVAAVTVLWVKVSKDLAFADIYVSVMGDDAAVAAGLHALGRCRSFIQREVATRVRLRKMPHFRFRLDKQYRSAVRVFEILKELERQSGGESGGYSEGD